jgi:hypothetical protein
MAEPKAVIRTTIADVSIAPAKIADHSTYDEADGRSEILIEAIDGSVMEMSPLWCRSAQTQEGENGHDDHYETYQIDDAVHNFLPK